MPRLTLEQRARRRATRKNNKLLAKYPLLVRAGVIDDWMTTPEQAQREIEQWDHTAALDHQRIVEFCAQQAERAEKLRAEVALIVEGSTLALLDNHLGIYPKSPDYACDLWWRVLNGRFDIHAHAAAIERARRLGET